MNSVLDSAMRALKAPYRLTRKASARLEANAFAERLFEFIEDSPKARNGLMVAIELAVARVLFLAKPSCPPDGDVLAMMATVERRLHSLTAHNIHNCYRRKTQLFIDHPEKEMAYRFVTSWLHAIAHEDRKLASAYRLMLSDLIDRIRGRRSVA